MTAPIPAAAHDLLHDRPTGHVATLRPDGRLSVTPVSLLFDGEHVRFSTTKDRAKFRNLTHDDRVAISIPHRNNPNLYVELRGTVTIEDDPDRTFIDAIARHYLDVDTYPYDRPGAERVTVTIEAEQVSMPNIPRSDDPPHAPDRTA